MIPKSEKALSRASERCYKSKAFIEINKESYSDYVDEALSDLSSAQNDLDADNLKWAIVKAYQALFFQCTAVLVKNLGIYSKDHGCLIIALLKYNLIKKDVLEKIANMFEHKKTLYEEIDRIRIFRNNALYFPKAQNKIGGKKEAEKILEDVRQLISALSEQL